MTRTETPQLNGNAAAFIKALKEIDRVVFDKRRHTKEETEAHRLATEALTQPPRNCDVGTAEEQTKRHDAYCMSGVVLCTYACKSCFAQWSQMPYSNKPTTTNIKPAASK